jgi:hypothetical protein
VLEPAGSVAIEIAARPIPLDLSLGGCSIAVTTNPFGFGPQFNMHTYAVVADWLGEGPVGMWITFTQGQSKHDPSRLRREVHAVFAAKDFRKFDEGRQATLPVLVGRWLVETGGLTDHSPDRTDRGDRWAHEVGGCIPARDQQGSAEEAEAQGPAVVALLNAALVLSD